jgi:hypothetical protein
MGVLFRAGRIGVGLRAGVPRDDPALLTGFEAGLLAALAAGFAAPCFAFPPSIFDHVGPDDLDAFLAAADCGIYLHPWRVARIAYCLLRIPIKTLAALCGTWRLGGEEINKQYFSTNVSVQTLYHAHKHLGKTHNKSRYSPWIGENTSVGAPRLGAQPANK